MLHVGDDEERDGGILLYGADDGAVRIGGLGAQEMQPAGHWSRRRRQASGSSMGRVMLTSHGRWPARAESPARGWRPTHCCCGVSACAS